MKTLAAIFVLLVPVIGFALEPPPAHPNHKLVTDYTGTLTEQQIATLNAKLQELERSDGSQIAVLMIPTLRGDDLFDFSQRAFQKWGIGQKKENNGALLLVVKNDRKLRIHAGYGLEARLTDALSKRIIELEIKPHFYDGNFYAGIEAGVNAMIAAVRGEYKAPAQSATQQTENSGAATILFALLFLGIWFYAFYSSTRRRKGRRGSYGTWYPGGWTSSSGMSSGGGGWSSGGGGWSGGGGGSFGGGSSGGGGASGSW